MFKREVIKQSNKQKLTSREVSFVFTALPNRHKEGLLISSGQNLKINMANSLNNLINSGELSTLIN